LYFDEKGRRAGPFAGVPAARSGGVRYKKEEGLYRLDHEKSCGAAVARTDGGERVYLIVHQKAGHWGLPKGHSEPGETEVCTARREIFEETGLSVEVCPDFRYVISYTPAPGVTKDVVFFAALCRDGSLCVQPEEIKEAVWLPFERALGLVTHEGTREVLRAAERYFATRDGLSEKA